MDFLQFVMACKSSSVDMDNVGSCKDNEATEVLVGCCVSSSRRFRLLVVDLCTPYSRSLLLVMWFVARNSFLVEPQLHKRLIASMVV